VYQFWILGNMLAACPMMVSKVLLVGDPCPGESGASHRTIPIIYPHSTSLLGLGIEESE
jgi:hypothetical protein